MPQDNLTNRVLSSTAALLVRSAWERLLSLAATLAVARLLTPRDFGEAALVLVIVAFATIAVDAGITASLVRGSEDPTTSHFAAARRAQFTLATVAVAAAAVIAVFQRGFGALLFLDSLQLLTDPLIVSRKVMLQRDIEFKGLALADGLGVLTRSVVSLAIAYPYPGPTCLVLGDLGAALVSAGVILIALPARAPTPGEPGIHVRSLDLVRQGFTFQLFSLVLSGRDLSSSALISGVVSLRALGVFQFAYRAISPVMLVFSSLASLALPVGVHVVKGDAGARQRVKEGYLLGGLATALIVSVAVTPAHWLVPLLFGRKWDQAIPLIFALAFAVVINGPACSFGVGLIMAANRARFATTAAVSCTVFFLVTLFALSSIGGLRALAIAWDVSAAVEAGVVLYACRRYLSIDLIVETLMPVPAFALPFLVGWTAGHAVTNPWAASFTAAAAALATSAALAAPMARKPMASLWRASRSQPGLAA